MPGCHENTVFNVCISQFNYTPLACVANCLDSIILEWNHCSDCNPTPLASAFLWSPSTGISDGDSKSSISFPDQRWFPVFRSVDAVTTNGTLSQVTSYHRGTEYMPMNFAKFSKKVANRIYAEPNIWPWTSVLTVTSHHWVPAELSRSRAVRILSSA